MALSALSHRSFSLKDGDLPTVFILLARVLPRVQSSLFSLLSIGRLGWRIGPIRENVMQVMDLVLSRNRRHDKGTNGTSKEKGGQERIAIERYWQLFGESVLDPTCGRMEKDSRTGPYHEPCETVGPDFFADASEGLVVLVRHIFHGHTSGHLVRSMQLDSKKVQAAPCVFVMLSKRLTRVERYASNYDNVEQISELGNRREWPFSDSSFSLFAKDVIDDVVYRSTVVL